MCDPVTGAMVAGTLMSAGGSIAQGRAENKIARANARMAEVQAADSIARGDIAEQQHLAKVRQVLGRQRAAFGGSGVSLADGTPADVMIESAKTGAEDAITIRNNAAREAWGLRVDAANSRAQGKLAKRKGLFDAGSTLLTGGAAAYGQYKKV